MGFKDKLCECIARTKAADPPPRRGLKGVGPSKSILNLSFSKLFTTVKRPEPNCGVTKLLGNKDNLPQLSSSVNKRILSALLQCTLSLGGFPGKLLGSSLVLSGSSKIRLLTGSR